MFFRDPIDVYSRAIRVIDAHGTPVESVPGSGILSKDGRRYTVRLAENLPDGQYSVEIHVLAKDGDPLQNRLTFQVRTQPDPSAGTRPHNQRQTFRLERAIPADGTLLLESPDQLVLRFTEPVARIFGVVLINDEEEVVDGESAHIARDDPHKVLVPLQRGLSAGSYKLDAYVYSQDNAAVSESLHFAVEDVTPFHVAGENPIKRASSLVTAKAGIQWFTFLALLAFAGGMWFVQVIAQESGDHRRWRQWSLALHGGSLLGLLSLFRLHWASLPQATFVDIISLPAGWVPLSQALVLSVAFWFTHGWVRLGLLSAILFLDTFTGHSFSPRYGGLDAMLLDALHLMSAAIWLGALLALLVMAPDGEWASWFRSAGRVNSRWALGSIGILALSGIAMATDYASSWRGFLASDWGKAVIWKAIGLTGIVALGAWQRRSLRRMAERVESFAVRAWLELAVGASILLVAAVLIDLNPLAGIFPEAVTRDGVEAKISIEPFSVGNNTVTIRFSHDPGFEQVKMCFYMPPDYRKESIAFHVGDGTYKVVGNQLHGPGTMYLDIEGETADGKKIVFPYYLEVPRAGL